MSENILSKIPFLDGNAKSFGVYATKIEAYAEFVGSRDALDPILMTNCPTLLELVALDVTMPDNQNLIDLYKAN